MLYPLSYGGGAATVANEGAAGTGRYAAPVDEPTRFPRAVYGRGEDPDPRFSMANERTLLAWLRTSLAFVAAGIAAATLADVADLRPGLLTAVAVSSSVVGAASAVTAYVRWARVERALRLRLPLPSPLLGPALVLAVVLVAAAGVVLGLPW
ncbi:hypothetical protein GCM10028777_36050 [Angustibacter speluncae]